MKCVLGCPDWVTTVTRFDGAKDTPVTVTFCGVPEVITALVVIVPDVIPAPDDVPAPICMPCIRALAWAWATALSC